MFLGAQKNRLIEMVLFSTHNICFGWAITKLNFRYALLAKVLYKRSVLYALYLSDSNVDILGLDIQVNAVATVLKAFFSDLTDPLVPVALYDELIEASGRWNQSSHDTKK